jgi:hypothetical protein
MMMRAALRAITMHKESAPICQTTLATAFRELR